MRRLRGRCASAVRSLEAGARIQFFGRFMSTYISFSLDHVHQSTYWYEMFSYHTLLFTSTVHASLTRYYVSMSVTVSTEYFRAVLCNQDGYIGTGGHVFLLVCNLGGYMHRTFAIYTPIHYMMQNSF